MVTVSQILETNLFWRRLKVLTILLSWTTSQRHIFRDIHSLHSLRIFRKYVRDNTFWQLCSLVNIVKMNRSRKLVLFTVFSYSTMTRNKHYS